MVTKIDDPELEHICIELGLKETIIPTRSTGRLLADKFEGRDPLELSTMLRDEARIYSFILPDDFAGTSAALELPNEARVVCVYRQEKLIIPEDNTELLTGDDVIVIVQRDSLLELEKRWGSVVMNTQ